MWPLSQGAVLADVPDILHSPLFPHLAALTAGRLFSGYRIDVRGW